MSRAKHGESNPLACMEIALPSVAACDDILATEHVDFEIYATPCPRAILPDGKEESSGQNLSRPPNIAITNFYLYWYQTDNVFPK